MSAAEVAENRDDVWRDACASALAGLADMGPSRMSELLNGCSPAEAWKGLADGSLIATLDRSRLRVSSKLLQQWRVAAQRTDPLDVLARYRRENIRVWTRAGTYPQRLVNDVFAPAVVFAQGAPGALALPTAAIIGTRHCTPEGRSLARTFGCELAEAGVSVVSGLALGIDGAAHDGALQPAFGAPPIGVVGSGLDVVYPKRHRELWHDVRTRGLLVSESALGASPEPWRFPARNRIIAGLADVVVVVESHDSGGSLLTVDQALERGVPVMALPGSVRSPACRGTNRLLMDGALPACSVADVLDVLGTARTSPGHELASTAALWADSAPSSAAGGMSSRSMAASGQLPPPGSDDHVVLAALGYESTSMDELLLRTALSPGLVAVCLHRLAARGLVAGESGWWFRTDCERAVT